MLKNKKFQNKVGFLLKGWPLFSVFILWVLFSFPFLFLGKIPFPSDYLATNFGPWNAYEVYTGPVKNGAAPDVITQIFPWKKLVIDSLKQGEMPFWNSYSFSGTPLLANYQSAALSPVNLIYFVLPFVDAWSTQILLAPLLAGIFMYLFVRSINISRSGALISSIAFMFCGFLATWMLYGTLSYAILFLPLALYSIEKISKTKKWIYGPILASAVVMSFFSGHFQTSLYFLLFVSAYLIFKLITEKEIKFFLLDIFLIISGILIAAPQILPSIEFYLNSVRSELFMKIEVIPWIYFPTLFAPDIFGNPVTRNDWFGHYAEWNAYIGLVPLILAIYSLKKKNHYTIFFAFAALASILLAFQSPLLDLLIWSKFPVLSTSAASRVIVLFSFSAAVLAGFGFDYLISDVKAGRYKKSAIIAVVTVIFFAITWIMVMLRILVPEERVTVAISNLKLPTLLLISFLAVIFIGKVANFKKTIVLIIVALIILTSFDMLRFVTKWQPFEDRNLIYPDVPVSKVLKEESGYHRAFGNFGQEAASIYRLPGVEGYDPLYIARYGEYIAAAKDGKFHRPERSVVALSKNGEFTGKILNFLGVKYIVHKISDGQNVWAFPFWEYPVDQFRIIYQDDKYQILENDKALPRAFLAGSYIKETDEKRLIRTVFAEEFDFAKTVMLEEEPSLDISEGSGSAEIVEYGANKIRIETKSQSPSLLVLTDPFYPGWKADINGRETTILRANYAFRAVNVPQGESIVTFTYNPDSFKIGLLIAGTGLAGVLFAIYIWKTKFQS